MEKFNGIKRKNLSLWQLTPRRIFLLHCTSKIRELSAVRIFHSKLPWLSITEVCGVVHFRRSVVLNTLRSKGQRSRVPGVHLRRKNHQKLQRGTFTFRKLFDVAKFIFQERHNSRTMLQHRNCSVHFNNVWNISFSILNLSNFGCKINYYQCGKSLLSAGEKFSIQPERYNFSTLTAFASRVLRRRVLLKENKAEH